MAIRPADHGVVSGSAAGFTPITATGGTISDVGDYRYHKFISSGTFEITANPETSTVEVNILAGASGADTRQGGGGGEWLALTGQTGAVDTYPIVIGAGGGSGGGGVDSSAYGTTATAGYWCGSYKGMCCGNGNVGGQNTTAGGNGGGGMGAVGGVAYGESNVNGGAGGAGLSHAVWTGVSLTSPGPGGGGGAGQWGASGGSGGYYQGGNGATTADGNGTNGVANTGGGGGGSGNYGGSAGLGGSGMVVLRYTLVAA